MSATPTPPPPPPPPIPSLTFVAREAGRLDATLKRETGLPGSRVKMAIESGKVSVRGERVTDCAHKIEPGAAIQLRPNAPNPTRTEPSGLRLVYRDEHLLVVDKPSGLVSAPIPDVEGPTALHAAYQLTRGGQRPKNVHRLDKETSGLLIFGRTTAAVRTLRAMLDAHDIRRLYRCVVTPAPQPGSGVISSMMVRETSEGRRGSRPATFRVRGLRTPDPGPMPGFGKLAITRFQTVAVEGENAAVEVWLSTGRTHQIRIHLAELGSPVLGERVYARVPGSPRQALHAARLTFRHPITDAPMDFTSPWPLDLCDLRPLGRDWEKPR